MKQDDKPRSYKLLADFYSINDCDIGEGTIVRDFVNLYGCRIGKDCKIAAYAEAEPSLADAYGYQPAHFVPILVGAELGVFGVLLLLGAAWLWVMEVRTYRRLLAGPLAMAALMLPIIPIVASCFDHWPLTAYAGILLTGVLFGLSLKAEKEA